MRVAAAAVGPDGLLTPAHLVRLFQEAAMQNTIRLKISSPELMERARISWVLRRQFITVHRWPRLGETGQVITAPTGFARKLLTYRDFHLVDAAGQTIVSAVSEWALISVSSRRLQLIPPNIAALESDLAPASAHLDRPVHKIPSPESPWADWQRKDFQIPYYQLDFNDHLTNSAYLDLMLESLPHGFRMTYLPTQIDIAYRQEARYGETVSSFYGQDTRIKAGPPNLLHELKRGPRSLAAMRTEWRRKATV